MTLTLEPVAPKHLRAVLDMPMADGQNRFVAPNAVSMAQNGLVGSAWPRAIVVDGEVAGFVMLELGDELYIWRLLIDARRQREGIGRALMAHLVECARRWGYARIKLSYVDEPGGPGPFYEKLGFTPTGEVDEGEIVMQLPVEGDGSPHHDAGKRYREVANELFKAYLHAKTAADHMMEGKVPRASAHAWSTTGHIRKAQRALDALAEQHADKSKP